MSEAELRAEKSSLLLEWTENNQELARMRAVAARLADGFAYIADALKNNPGESTSVNVVAWPDLEEAKKVCDAVRTLEARQSELRPRMVAFNLPL